MNSAFAKIVAGSVLLLPSFAAACICAYKEGEWAAVSQETSVLLWDEKTHTEHFIRSIKFANMGEDFGFLIPTPTVPEIKDADNAIFKTFDALVWDTKMMENMRGQQVPAASAGGVEVIAEQRAAGLIATTLKADGGASLKQWMDANGYVTTPYTSQWAQPYLDKHWPMTVFKIDPADNSKSSEPRAIRMSFHSDQLYYPYNGYQPENSPKAPERSLKMYLMSNTDLRFSDQSAALWKGDLKKYRGTIPSDFHANVAQEADLPGGSLDGMNQIYEIENAVPANTRTQDLYFQANVLPEPKGSSTAIVFGCALGGIGIGLWFLKRRG